MCHIRHFLCFGILVAITELPAFAGNVTLAWNASTNPIVTGYNLYFWIKGGVSTNKVSVGNATSVTVSNLVAGATYYFATTTFDSSGLESPFSAEAVNQPPTLNLVTPTANQLWTNGTFTVTGKAGDILAVEAVYYSLNGSGWTAAATGNAWTNWTANLTPTPGTNTVQAYAVDTSGNFSPTNTVKFVYLVRLPLTVNINGKGTVNPNYNGALLAINENSTMTASAASGFAFTNWTDGSGNVLTNRATLQFTMLTNLTLTANFVDVQKPTVRIVTPTSNQHWTNGTFTVTGRAGDNVAVGRVYYSLNGSGWTAATTTNTWTNWSANLTLTPGFNTLQAYAADTSGNLSPTNTVKFIYLVRLPLTVHINGKGSVNPNYNGTLLDVNMSYTMNASAASGFAFTNWADGAGHVLTNRTTLQFTMLTNLILTANFVDITRPSLSIVTPTLNLRVSNAVFAVTGKASDNVAVGMVYYSLNGAAWTEATTGNNWTNWMAAVTLLPGTNTIRAYAVDTSGNISPTNSSKVNLALPPPAFAALGSAAYADGRYAFVVSGAVGYKYNVQASSDLVNWVSLQTNITPFTFVDTNAGQFNRRFYRSVFNH